MLVLGVNVTRAAIGAFGFRLRAGTASAKSRRCGSPSWADRDDSRPTCRNAGDVWLAAKPRRALHGLRRSRRAARSWLYLSTAGRSAEFFGLWGFATPPGRHLGPLTYGAVTDD